MTYLDIHILQTVPPSNLNRDDTGSPKSAVFGGVRRARVSSQSWKRAARAHFNATLDTTNIGYRTKRVVDLVANAITGHGTDDKTAAELATAVVKAAGITTKAPRKPKKDTKTEGDGNVVTEQSDYLIFVSAGQIAKLAELAVAAHGNGQPVAKSDAKKAFKADQSFDVALFGRMVADDAELNIDAAAQVAHAISVHAVDNEFDYFTAVDDLQAADNQTGAGMIGTVEFNSSTLYRYATLNVAQLQQNLGDTAATGRAAAAFVDAFVRSMPTGKQNTFANRTLPEAVLVVARDDQPVNLVGAFEDPIVRKNGESTIGQTAQALGSWNDELAAAYGSPSATWLVGTMKATEPLAEVGDLVNLEQLVREVETLAARTAGHVE